MKLSAGTFTTLLQTLRLTQGVYKPGQPGPLTHSRTLAGNLSSPYSPYTPVDNSEGQDASASSCSPVPYDPPSQGEVAFPPFDEAKAVVYRYRQQQSVNLGSW